jgi:hypothetical protein
MNRAALPLWLTPIAFLLASSQTMAASSSIAQVDSFRIGSAGVVCTAQNRSADPLLKSMFDRAFSVVCQDAASSVGKIYKIAGRAAPEGSFSETAVCGTAELVSLGAVQGVNRTICTASETGLRFVRLSVNQGKTSILAEGLAGYESAMRLGFQSVLMDRAVPGTVDVAVTEAGDPAAFARVQAGNLDPDQALAEGYVRNNTGSFPEAAEFFDALLDRARGGNASFSRTGEYAANRALQLSNIGRFLEADTLFATAETALDLSDPVQTRLLRNYRMIHALNQANGEAALAMLRASQGSRSLQMPDVNRLSGGFLDRPIVQRLNTEDGQATALGGTGGRLSATERAQLLDAQSRYLEGAALRLTGKNAEARLAQPDAACPQRQGGERQLAQGQRAYGARGPFRRHGKCGSGAAIVRTGRRALYRRVSRIAGSHRGKGKARSGSRPHRRHERRPHLVSRSHVQVARQC